MTLREFGQSIVDYWNAYITEVTTQNVLDWSISHLFLSAFLAFIGMIAFTLTFGLLAVVWIKLSEAWEKTGLPYTIQRLDKRFGPFYAGLIVVAGTVGFFVLLGLIFALIEMAQS